MILKFEKQFFLKPVRSSATIVIVVCENDNSRNPGGDLLLARTMPVPFSDFWHWLGTGSISE